MSYHLFDVFGIELEYMLVRSDTLDVDPSADRVFLEVNGDHRGEAERGEIAWSNELALHVIELKTNGPAASLDGLDAKFHGSAREINAILEPAGARLMPTAMHPWMDPAREARLWPHDSNEVYEAFDRIFDCRGHGWTNLQSMHVNLPFTGDDEFGRLHAAIRMLLPILPALAASSPIVDGKPTGLRDSRLEVYRSNCARVPSVTGRVIPEPVYTKTEYEREIFERMYRDIAPLDRDSILQEEWLNARGAIARFDRDTIEIRVIDVQECPKADLAIARLTVAVLRALASETWCPMRELESWSIDALEPIQNATIREGERAIIEDEAYLRAFGVSTARARAGDVWTSLAAACGLGRDPALEVIVDDGTLSTRILRRCGSNTSRERIEDVYRELCDCLDRNRMFI